MLNKIVVVTIAMMIIVTTGMFFKMAKHKTVQAPVTIDMQIDKAKITTWDESWEQSRN